MRIMNHIYEISHSFEISNFFLIEIVIFKLTISLEIRNFFKSRSECHSVNVLIC